MNPRGSAALWLCAAACFAAGVASPLRAQGQPAPSNPPSVANPATSVIGWFQGVAGNDTTTQNEPFLMREAEIGFQSAVDPYTRAEFFLSVGPEGLDLEEGYIVWLALPWSAQAKVGKFRADLGKFNRTHPPEAPFADRPLATLAFLGDEGLSTIGVSLSTVVPNPLHLYWDLVADLGTPPDSLDGPLFQSDSRSDLLALGRTSVFVPLHESADLNLGVSYVNALANPALRGEGHRAQVAVGDVTMHWKNPRRSSYRSLLVQGELMLEQGSAPDAPRRSGGFGFAVYQFARQWKLGARYDWTEAPGSSAHESGALALLTWQPSEFSTLSLQGRRVRGFDGADRDAAFFKWTFNIGPHGAHPY